MAMLSGKPLIAHAVELVQSTGLEVSVITEKSRNYSFLDCQIFFDRESYGGPLAGLERAFEAFPGERILVLTCDMPFIEKNDLLTLLDHRNSAKIVLYKLHSDRFQPFPGVYASSLKNKIRLDGQGVGSMQDFIKEIDDILEITPTEPINRFININTMDSLSNTRL